MIGNPALPSRRDKNADNAERILSKVNACFMFIEILVMSKIFDSQMNG